MRIRFCLPTVAWATLLGLFLAGCSHSDSPELAPVRGTVTYKGKPLAGGTIVFAPDPTRNTPGPLAHAEIQTDGTYQLKSGEAAGAAPGWHRVTVVALLVPPPVKGQTVGVPRSLIPEKYRDPELSGLSCEVTAGKDNTINFNLE